MAKRDSKKTAGVAGGLAAGGGALGGGAIAGAGGVTVTTCPPDDTSFYCSFVKGFNIFKMGLAILAVLAIVAVVMWFIWTVSRHRKGHRYTRRN